MELQGHASVHLCWPPWPAPIKKTMVLMFLRYQGSGWEGCCICFCEQPKKRTQMEVESGGYRLGPIESREAEELQERARVRQRRGYDVPSHPALPSPSRLIGPSQLPSFRMGPSSPPLSTSCSSCGSKVSFTQEPGLPSPTLPLVCVFLTL